MATILQVTSSAPPIEPAKVSTDGRYLGHRFTNYTRSWLGEWTVERIREHRDAHQAGRVYMGKRLARFFRRDANFVAALGQRVAPWLACGHVLKEGDEAIRLELEQALGPRGSMLTAPAKRDSAEDLATCGLSILQVTWQPRKDGSRWDPIVEPWDLEAVDYDSLRRQYIAVTQDGSIPISHGDGKWIVLRTTHLHPHEHGAVVPLSLNIASRGHIIVDRASGAEAVGHPKLVAKLPEGIAVKDEVGKSLDTALGQFWEGVRHIVVTAKTAVEKFEFAGSGWQIFPQSLKLDRTDIFLALTGQDGSATNEGGSYAKAYILQGVLFDWVVADVMAGSHGFSTGLLRPWAAVNKGDESAAPWIGWPFPDPEDNERLAALAKRHKDYADTLKMHHANGHEITVEYAARLASEFGISAPALARMPLPELLAYHQRGGIFTRDEIRVSRGREPFGGERGAELVDDKAPQTTQEK
ncbi:MAG: hypothetical protein IPM54_25000 [Polyangiaceae bacterium]|nr:hypothetical protein [Polyangiaceae bacterium]